jgi:uncharacterized protein
VFLFDGTVIYSATDLTAAATCEWALMRTLDAKLGRVDAVVEETDAMLERTAALGDVHERRTLENLRRTARVVEFERPDIGGYAAAASATEDALRHEAEVLFQATFFDGRFLGYADFIIRTDDGRYEVYDTKLARRAKITALLQLAAYSDQLVRLGIPIGEHVHLILGDNSTSTHRVDDVLPVYRKRRGRLEGIIDGRLTADAATEWGDPRYAACGRCAACAEQVVLHRDVLLVANMKLSQRKKLSEAGVVTIEELATVSGTVPGMADTTLATLRDQARLQLGETLRYEVFNPVALGAVPEPDDGDIFFDFEGDPLYSENAEPEWGLDYLFGLVETDGTFRAFWAHNHAEERQALVDFLAYVRDRRQRYPGLHIYHYAAYERTHLLSLAARHGVGEDEVDDLLRAHVLVDLYPIVRKSLRIGSHSYSIKKLEPLYMGDQRREGVDNAADSITEYAQARLLWENGETHSAQAKLDAIADYNEYDCVSTLKLRDWLRALAAEARVLPARADDLALDPPVRDPSPVHLELSAQVEGIPPAARTADETALALASAAIDYHRREGKIFWQEHFGRLRDPVEDWADTRDVLVIDQSSTSIVRDWAVVGNEKTASRILLVAGAAGPGSSFRDGHKPYLIYDPPFPPIEETGEPGSRRTHARAEIVGSELGAYFVKEKVRKDAATYDQLPLALGPPTPPDPGSQVSAIADWGRRVLDELPGFPADAALDILRRIPPRGNLAPAGSNVSAAMRDSLLTLDRSYLAVQGPPGTGKTFTGSRVIADLVLDHGWKVGVVAQSHAAVENMLRGVLEAGLDPARVGKKPKQADTAPVDWTPLDAAGVALFAQRPGGWVLGGTAWDFSNVGRIPRGHLDLLVIDEAGQFSLAATIASALGAKRLLLLGDPQQLPQVSQGKHPEPVDVSALGWLTHGHDVLPAEFGYFLADSYRMHPDLCAPVSRLSYEGKLDSVAPERRLEGVAPGLHPVPVPVPGAINSTSSPEEAERVIGLALGLLGRPWTSGGETRQLSQEDLIVVAPYNAQVGLIGERLAEEGLSRVSVGTVDKFQGREAAVAIISLAASSAAEVPRGLEFLLLANRLNVAISRAQWAAYLLYSPALTEYLPANPAALAQLSAFIRLVEAPSEGAPMPETGGFSSGVRR